MADKQGGGKANSKDLGRDSKEQPGRRNKTTKGGNKDENKPAKAESSEVAQKSQAKQAATGDNTGAQTENAEITELRAQVAKLEAEKATLHNRHQPDSESELDEQEASALLDTDDESHEPLKKSRKLHNYKIPKLGKKQANNTVHDIDKDIQGLLDDSEEGELDSDPEWLDNIAAQFDVRENLGPDIEPKLANVINNMFKNMIPDEKCTELLNKIKKPANLTEIKAPKVNPEIWAKLSSTTRGVDIKMQKVAHKITMIASGLALSANEKLKAKNKIETQVILDKIAVAATAMQEVNQARREAIKPDLLPRFRSICGKAPDEPSEYLFGTDLQSKIKEMEDSDKVGLNMTGKSYYKHKKPFLGQRKPEYTRYRDNKDNYNKYRGQNRREKQYRQNDHKNFKSDNYRYKKSGKKQFSKEQE